MHRNDLFFPQMFLLLEHLFKGLHYNSCSDKHELAQERNHKFVDFNKEAWCCIWL